MHSKNGRNHCKEKNNDIIAKAFPLNYRISPFDFYPLQSSTVASKALPQKQKDLKYVGIHYCILYFTSSLPALTYSDSILQLAFAIVAVRIHSFAFSFLCHF